MKIIEARIKPEPVTATIPFYKITVLVDDCGNIKAYQSLRTQVDYQALNFAMENGSKLSFNDAKKIFPDILEEDYDL